MESPEQHALKNYEKELTEALLKNAPRSLLTLAEKAHGRGLISGEVNIQLKSLDPSVPHHLICRFLLLHICKKIYSKYKLEILMELFSTVRVASGVLSLVRQYYWSLINRHCPDSEDTLTLEHHVSALTEILAGYSSKWKEIATALWLTNNKIENIIAMNCKPILALKEVLLSWVVGECEHSKPPTLQNLKEALRSQIVGLGNVASTLQIDEIIANEGKPISKIEDSGEDIQIISPVDITEGCGVLLGINVYGYHEINYQWSKKDEHSGNFKNISKSNIYSHCNKSILYIFVKDLTVEGYYKCMVINTKREFKYSEPILLVVNTPLGQYQSILISNNTMSPEIPVDTWPPVNTNSYINLALIKQESIHKAGKYGRCTIRGDMDDIYEDKESITYDKALGCLSSGACLLIEGRPGSGKTTLVHKFSQDWARSEITVAHVRLLFLIHLRGFCSNPNIGLGDLIGCYFSGSDVEVIGKYANKHQGLGLCFVLDGLDEYIPQKKNAYIYELIRKRVLPKSVVIVASRPAAAADFRSDATRQIEVLGFLRDQIYDYIEKYTFSSPSKSHTGLIRYLDEHPNVLHMCYLPIHTCMICFLYDNLESDLPQTETNIYAEFTKFTILRMLYRDDSNSDMCIELLTDLPEPQNQLYITICKLAFEMTSSSKQVIRQTEVKNIFNLQPTDKDCMGLITVDKMAMMCGFQKLYTFLHLTFQEFLTAFYISILDGKKQMELIEQFRDAIQMKQVWKFFCGLVPLNVTNSRLIDQSCHGTSFKVQCLFESQQPQICDSVIDNNSLVFNDHFFTSSDFTAIAYVISNAQHQCVMKVVFDKCTIGMEGVGILAQKACGKLSLITTLCYHGYDCVTEQLLVVSRLIHLLPCLEILDISNTNLGPAEIDTLAEALKDHDLRRLNISCNNIGNSGINAFATALYSCPHLEELNVSFNRFEDLGACSLASSFCYFAQCFHKLDISNNFIASKGCKAIAEALQLCVNLRELCISHSLLHSKHTGAIVFGAAVKHCTNLFKLDISYNYIGSDGINAIAKALKHCPHLEELNASFNHIEDFGACSLASSFCYYAQCLHKLDISNNPIGSEGCKAIAEALQLCVNLRELCISHSLLRDGTGAIVFADAVKHCTNLVKLDISYNYIGSDGINAIAKALKHCSHLEELNVSYDHIEDFGACSLASSFCYYAMSLHKLDISNNHISSTGCKAIAEALRNVNIRELDFSFNCLKDSDAIILTRALTHCTSLHVCMSQHAV